MADLSKIYSFIGKLGANWDQAIDQDATHGNKNGVLQKSELRSYLKGNVQEWSGEESNVDDLINKFWESIDTNISASDKNKITTNDNRQISNVNALSQDEVKAMENKVLLYEKVNEFTSNNDILNSYVNYGITEPAAISAWQSIVKAALDTAITNFVNNEGDVNTLETTIVAEVADDITRANETAWDIQLKNDAAVKNAILNYDNAEKSAILNELYAQVAGGEYNHYNEIVVIKDAYLATKNAENTEEANSLNKLQTAELKHVITEQIEEGLASEYGQDYAIAKAMFAGQISSFISTQVSATTTQNYKTNVTKTTYWDELKAQLETNGAIEEFEKKKEIMTFLSDNASKIKAIIGEEIYDMLEANGSLKKVEDEIASGNSSFPVDANISERVKWVVATLDKYIAELKMNDKAEEDAINLQDQQIGLLVDDYDDTYDGGVNSGYSDTDRTAAARAALKDLGDYIKALGEPYKSAVESILGASVDKMSNSEIKAASAKLCEFYAIFKAGVEVNATYANKVEAETKGNVIKLNAQLKNGNSLKGVEYELTGIKGKLEGDKFTYDAPEDAPITMSGKITVKVDGIVVGTKDIKIDVEKIKPKSLTESDTKIKDSNGKEYDVSDVMNYSTTCTGIKLNDWNKVLTKAQDTAKTNVINVLTELAVSLKEEGYDEGMIDFALDATIKYYSEAIDAIEDLNKDNKKSSGEKTKSITITLENGKKYSENITYGQYTCKKSDGVDIVGGEGMLKATTGCGLRLEEYTKGDDTKYVIGVNIKALLSNFEKFMKMY